MAIIQINSQDPQFGFIIRKNPNSGMQVRSIRKGTAFGWFSNEGTSFNILFKDADNAVSFGDQEFEFLNTSRYNSPLFVLNAIGEFFSSTVRDIDDRDTVGIEKSFVVNMVNIKQIRQINQFKQYFKEFDIEVEHYAAKSYKLTVVTKETFNHLFNFMNLMMVFITIASTDEYIQLDQASVEKYMLSIERLDAPFFIRYLFSRAMFRSKNQFSKYKDRLETTNRHNNVNMVFGDTATQRRTAIEKLIPFNKPILDIGCGEGFYAIPFSQKIKDYDYVAIDIVKTLTDTVMKKASKKEIENIKTFNSFKQFINSSLTNSNYDIILTEVIEHMPKEQSAAFINDILNNVNFDNFIITVPNKDFNKFYMIDEDDFRHIDHNWEPTFSEFNEFILKIIKSRDNMNIQFLNIGDTIDGISTSVGCKITKV